MLLLALAAVPFDLPSLDAAIARCDRDAVMPVFAAEAARRSAAMTAAYMEQAAILGEREVLAGKASGAREAALPSATSDAALAAAGSALDDRQRIFDDRQRLEALRQAAMDLKRSYFLTSCATGKKPGP